MKKLVLTYGLISGLIVSAWLVAVVAIGMEHMDNTAGMFVGYTSMIIAFSFIVVAVKNYRENHGGTITFGKAFRIGLYISLIASTMYVISWIIDYHFFVPDFMDTYAAHAVEKLKTEGASVAEINKTAKEMAEFKEMYKNPVVLVLFTYSEILPVGLLISLLTALFLRKIPKAATGI